MQEIYSIELENGKQYDVIDRIITDQIIYFYLVEAEDYQNMLIQKSLVNGEIDELLGISDSQEFQYALSLFQEKYPDLLF